MDLREDFAAGLPGGAEGRGVCGGSVCAGEFAGGYILRVFRSKDSIQVGSQTGLARPGCRWAILVGISNAPRGSTLDHF